MEVSPTLTPPRLRIAPDTDDAPASMTTIHLGDAEYRIEFWPDERWDRIPAPSRPVAERAKTDDGWFALTRVI